MNKPIAAWRPARIAVAWLCALALLGLATPPAAAASVRYVVGVPGPNPNPIGEMLRETTEAGVVRVRYAFRDNGRGPDLVEEFALDAAGTVTRYEVTGSSTFGGAVRERFDRRGTQVAWSSLVDRGEREQPEPAWFLPVESSPEWLAQMVHAVAAQSGRAMPGIPAGQFSVERLDEFDLEPAGTPGRTHVALYALGGLDLAPVLIWMRDDAPDRLFALVSPWWYIAEAGFEGAVATLIERQQVAQRERLRRLAVRLAKPLPGVTLIQSVRWFDATGPALRGPSDVYLFGGRIAAIEPAGAPHDAVDQVIDGRGKTLLPGLFDMHAHIAAEEALLHLASGVTTVRDMANDNRELLALRERIDGGIELGPRIVPNGLIEGRSDYSLNAGFVCASLDEARRAVDWYHQRGYRSVKLYNSFKPEWVKPLADYVHRRGMRVSGHVPAFMRAEQAVAAGYDELTHINQVTLNFLVGPRDDTRTLLRFSLVGDKAQRIDLDGARVRHFVDTLRRRGTVVDPTLATFEAAFLQRNGEPNPSFDMIAPHLPAALQRGLRFNSANLTADNAARYRGAFGVMRELVGRLHRAGVPLVAGTDNLAGFTLHRELELYVQAGIAPLEVLRIATFNGARQAGVLAETGSIARGKQADLLLVDGDPSQRIGDIRNTELVIKGGVAIAPDAVYDALGIRPFRAAAPIVSGAAPGSPRSRP